MFTSHLRQTDPSQVRNPLLRRAFLLAMVPAVILAGRIAKSDVVHVPVADGSDWSIKIAPATQFVQAPATDTPESAVETASAEALAPTKTATVVPETVVPEPLPVVESHEGRIVIAPNPIASPQAAAYTKIYNAIPFNRTEYLANPSYRHETAMELLTGNQRQIVVHRNYTPQLNQPTERHPLFLYKNYGGGRGYGGYGGFGLGSLYNNYSGLPPTFRYFQPIEDAY